MFQMVYERSIIKLVVHWKNEGKLLYRHAS